MKKNNNLIRILAAALIALVATACSDITPDVPGRSSSAYGERTDGGVTVLNAASADAAFTVIILAEGYTADERDSFVRTSAEACEDIFSLEPLRSLRGNVEVRALFQASSVRGVPSAGSGVSGIYGTVKGEGACDYTADADRISRTVTGLGCNPTRTAVMLLCNHTGNGGRSHTDIYAAGEAISYCFIPATVVGDRDGSFFRMLVLHECCGHCIGLLGDEYVENDGLIPEADRKLILNAQKYGSHANIAFGRTAAWDAFAGRDGYETVGYYEGAALYARGAYRCEMDSVMGSGEGRFNVISRKAIYERVTRGAGIPFAEFDKDRKDGGKAVSFRTKGGDTLPFNPLGNDFEINVN